jgi:hypothetical protein
MEIVSQDPATAGKNALTLVALFEDQELQIVWGSVAGRTVSKRLEWLLELTNGNGDYYGVGGIGLQFHYASLFGDSDCWFGSGFRDNHLYHQKKDGKLVWQDAAGETSNQVGHFLTAVGLSYGILLDIAVLKAYLSHELVGDKRGVGNQLQEEVTEQMRQDFLGAVMADAQGNRTKRDELLWGILGFGGTVAPDYIESGRTGNSLPDLRLDVKGYRFGKWVKNNSSLSPNAGAIWLRQNILVGVWSFPNVV